MNGMKMLVVLDEVGRLDLDVEDERIRALSSHDVADVQQDASGNVSRCST